MPQSPGATSGTARAKLSAEELEPACNGVVPETVNTTWRLGGLTVAGGSSRTESFAASDGVEALVVIQNGNGRGTGEAQAATVSLNGVPVGAIAAGQRLNVSRVALQVANQLTVEAQDGGQVRVSVATLGSLPCVMADTGYLAPGHQPALAVFDFEPKGEGTLGVLLVDMVGATADAQVLLNGVNVLAGIAPAQRRAFATAIPLNATNHLEVSVQGGVDSNVRVAVFDADTLPTELSITEPEHGAYFIGSPVVVAGRYGRDGKSLTINGVPAWLVGFDGFRSDVPLVDGVNSITAVMADSCGNVSRVCRAVVLDTHAPTLTIQGVSDGDVTQGPVTVAWQAASPYVVTTSATLNGAPFQNNTTVSAEGEYDLLVTAEDLEGRVAMKRVRFTLLLRAPLIEVTGVSEGEFAPGWVTPSIKVTSPYLEVLNITLNGMGHENNTPVTQERTHTLFVVAKDRAANYGFATVNFTIDWTYPVVALSGVVDGAHVKEPVVVSYTATDIHMAPEGVEALLDGQPYLGGDTIAAEGPHTVEVRARDKANNRTTSRVSFTLDYTPPVLSVGGVPAAGPVAVTVTPTFSATDTNLGVVGATLNGAPFSSGTEVVEDGAYFLEVRAEDLAGNATTSLKHFVIDRTAPIITVSGVRDGEQRRTPATISWTVEDAHPGTDSATLDDAPFTSGSTVASGGTHLLVITATDSVGNTRVEQRSFSIDVGPPSVTIHAPSNGLVTREAQVELEVEVVDGSPVDHVEVGGELLSQGADGRWRRTISLLEGVNQLVVQVLDTAGNTTTRSVSVVRDSTPPTLTLTGPSEGARIGALTVTVHGSVSDATPVILTINGGPAALSADGTFEVNRSLVQGANTLELRATDAASNEVRKTLHVRANATPPTLSISEPLDGLVTEEASITVRGTAVPADGTDTVTVVVAGVLATTTSEGGFSRKAPLSPGGQTLLVVAMDGYGLRSEASVSVTRGGASTDGGPAPDAGGGVDAGGPPGGDAGVPTQDAGHVEPSPSLSLDQPSPGAVLGGPSVAVSGQVRGGTLPLTVTINGVNASVSVRSFSMALALTEGDHSLSIVVTDAEGRTASTTRDLAVDRTPPYLTVTRPSTSPVTVNESPYLIQGEVGDLHLAGVSVGGQPATILGGTFSASIALQSGESRVDVTAIDEAGNTRTESLRLTVDGAPPRVTMLLPVDGSASDSPLVLVRARVEAFAELAEVLIGTGPASEVSPGVYEAQLAVPLGESTIQVTARDVQGLIGRGAVTVRYRDPATEPLVVTGVQPAAGAAEVKPDALISVSFNKAATLESVRAGFDVLYQGTALEGGHSLAPGGQTASFIARSPLPEGAVLRVRVRSVAAEVGPGQASEFVSELTVRRPLTRVRGYVMDSTFQPLPGVRVVLEGTEDSARTSADGNWSLLSSVSGPRVLRFEGGASADGKPLPTVRRLLTVTPEAETLDAPLVLTEVDTGSATRVDTSAALHMDFANRHGALAIDGPPGALLFEDGQSQGMLTATRIAPIALPLKLESNASPTAVWQVGPVGVRVQKPVLLTFPNVTHLEAGRYAVVLAHDPRSHMLARMGLARVADGGDSVVAESLLDLRSVELVGYMALTDEQDAIVRQALSTLDGQGGTSTDGGVEGSLPRVPLPLGPPVPLWKRALDALLLGEAHAQAFVGLFPFLDQHIQAMVPAVVSGALRAQQDRQLAVGPTQELSELISVPRQVSFPYSLPVSLLASRVATSAAGEPIEAFISAKSGTGGVLLPPQGETWSATTQSASAGELRLAGNVELSRGTTVITLGGRLGTELRTYTLTVQASPVGDAGTNGYRLTFTRDEQSLASGVAVQSVVRFPDMRVTVTGPGPTMSGATGPTGEYGIPVMVAGGEAEGIACADVPLGPRPILGRDPLTGAAVVQSMVMASYPTCSTPFQVTSGRQTRADILVDARLLHGALHFVDREGRSLRRDCAAGGHSQFDTDGGSFASIADEDITKTEVHFFRADDLEHPIAQFTVGVAKEQCEQPQPGQRLAQGHYARVRVGPTAPFKRAIRERCRELNPAILDDSSAPPPINLGDADRAFYETECRDNRNNFLRLSAGEPLVVVAVNHATGHTGMTRASVPPISKWSPGPDGRCLLDEQQGPLKVVDSGQEVSLSRCSVQALGIDVPVALYPPEIDVRVWRSAEAGGVRQDQAPTLVRHGGAATTRDTYVHVDTHWRVRTSAPEEWRAEDGGVRQTPLDAGFPPEWFDGGVSPCREASRADGGTPDGGAPCLPDMLRDEGVSGRILETCSEYGEGANSSAKKLLACRRNQDLEDVPKGVPPLAGRVVRVTSSAAEEPAVAQFAVVPGRGSAALQAAMRVVTPSGQRLTLGSLPSANYYLHVVGHEVFPRDLDGDGALTPAERNARPPDFSEPLGTHPAGLPQRAVGLKNVYASMDPDGFRVLRYDRDREHEFRVLGLTNPHVTATTSTGTRPLEGSTAEADSDDLAYSFLSGLLEPEREGRAPTPVGDYVVRFGGDAFGIECDVSIKSQAITGSCDGEFIDDVLSANDLLYVELYLSGNAENVLYRFNLMGLSPRTDLLKAGSAFTARRSVEVAANGGAVKDRPVSIPAAARFALDPDVIRRGRVKVCTSDTCAAGSLVKQADVELLPNGAYRVQESGGGLGEDALEQLSQTGLNGARHFALPIPAQLVPMPGSGGEARRFFLVQEILEPEVRRLVQTLGRPRGVFEGLNARAPGQLTVQGINVADGHLSFEHEDFSVPQLAEAVRFSRTYNNQSSLVSTTGVGWTNNLDGFVQEENLGRYAVVVAGQSYDFPTCGSVSDAERTATDCTTDRSHGLTLRIEKRAGSALAVVQTAEGAVYEFGMRARGHALEERRRWLLDRYHDGHGRGDGSGWTVLTYRAGTNLVERVERAPGRLQLVLDYEPINLDDESIANRLRNQARNQGFALLATVELRLKSDGSVIHALRLTHDKQGNLLSVARTSALPATQVWEYDYAAPPEDLSGSKLWSASNEVAKAKLKLSPPEGGTPVIQWVATYGREAQPGMYAHVSAAEAVTSVVGTGMPAPGWRIQATDTVKRTLTRPDGVTVSLDLNEYGNASATTLPGLGPSTAAWGSDVRGGPVQVDRTVSSTGRALSHAVNDRMQVDGVSLSAAPPESLPVPGAGSGRLWSVSARQPTTGRAVEMKLATGHGEANVSQPRNAAGDSTGLSVQDPLHGVVFSAQQLPDVDGVVQQGVDPTGNTLTFLGHEEQALGLPGSAEVSRVLTGAGGLDKYTVEYEYDVLGNRISELNRATGARVQLTYDAVGRLLSRTVSGRPPQVWTYSYLLGDDTLVVTESVALGRWSRSQSRTTELREGLVRNERYTYGAQGLPATIQYDTYQGSRLQSFLDARGQRHTLTYDSAGRQTGESVGGVALYSYVLDGEGNITQATDSRGLVTRVLHDALGRAVRWEYESKGAGEPCPDGCRFSDVETVVLDAAGAVVQRTFGTLAKKHVLESTTDAMGRELSVKSSTTSHGGVDSKAFHDGAGRVTRRVDDELGLEDTYEYDDVLGRMTRSVRTVQSANGARTLTETRAYSDTLAGTGTVQVTRVLNGRGPGTTGTREEVRTYTVDTQGRVLGLTETVDGQLAQHAWDYDALGREVSYQSPSGRITTREYDTAGNLLEVVEPGGITTRFTQDAQGNVLSQVGPQELESWAMTYDGLGRLQTRTLASTTLTGMAQWSYSHPGEGVEVEGLPDGASIARTYNARGLVELEVQTGTGGERSVRTRYDGTWVKRQAVLEGASSRIVDRGAEAAIDDRGRIRNEVETWSAPDHGYQYTTTTNWSGRQAVSTESWSMGGQSLGGRTVTVVVDGLGNVIRKTQSGAADQWDYYADGKSMRMVPFGFDASAAATTWTYDTSGRLKSQHFGPEETSYAYYADGLLRSVQTPDNRIRTLSYNARGLLENETYGQGTDLERTRYAAYDGAGNATDVRYAAGTSAETVWSRQYGPRGELVQVTQPGNELFTYTYDGLARLETVTPPAGSVTKPQQFTYDFLGRELLRKRGTAEWTTTWTNGSPEESNELGERVEQVLDGRGRVIRSVFKPGTPTQDASGVSRTFKDLESVSYVFNGLDQLCSATEHRAGIDLVRSMRYDGRDRLEAVTSGSETVEYGYYDSNALLSIQAPSGTVNYTVDGLQRLQGVTLANGTVLDVAWEQGGARLIRVGNSALKHSYCHDGRGRLTSVTHDARAEGCASPIASPRLRYSYAYDERGNRLTELLERFESGGPGMIETTEYGYDPADRLTGVRYPSGQSVLYRMHADGARSGEKRSTSYTGSLGAGGFDVLSAPQQHLSYHYDANLGSLKESRDPLNGNAVVTQYAVDAAGRRARETRGSLTRMFHFDAAGRLVEAELDDGVQLQQVKYQYDYSGLRRSRTVGSTTTRYLWSGGSLIEEQLPGAGGAVLYQRAAGLELATGSTRILQDGLGSAVGRLEAGVLTTSSFDAWGGYRSGTPPPSTQASLGYTGHAWDAEVGLNYAQQRWYDSATGQFLSEDPLAAATYLATPTELNPWGYARTNPLRYVDPTGETAWQRMLGESLERQAQEWLKWAKPGTPEHKAAMERYTEGQKWLRKDEESRDLHTNVGLPIMMGGSGVAMAPVITTVGSIPIVAKMMGWVGVTTLALSQTSGQVTAPIVYGPAVDAAECATREGSGPDRVGACIRTGTELVTLGMAKAPDVRRFTRQLGSDLADDWRNISRQASPVAVTPEGVPIRFDDDAADLVTNSQPMQMSTGPFRRGPNGGRGAPVKMAPSTVTGQVGYGSTDLAQEAIRMRKTMGLNSRKANVAVFEYEDANGVLQLTAVPNLPMGKFREKDFWFGVHSEEVGRRVLADAGIDPAKVRRVYSERQPCMLPGKTCSTMLAREFPNAKVTYSFDYGATVQSRHAGNEAMDKSLSDMGIK
ncbi:hypothetical protein FJV41_11785 [Myxococcus llanfairpwllgwyngyllgogerychwyrndrobwllllantysiliogogogochensis]|uniref:DUF6531 domain-containing protein n=1 Tax=Myxococcus llanfairpwllgwyngyllgogerychwyrndrobwllllantysiliogogogochensis TaxID=2590453 RepID=A0A540X3E0_9BACT|nr:nucleic acid/nucleotide deaminase domain-containing protein [Myxococcus llanfairpwllgwyngyllgogerychwyrndrobwllllantysiliogogogochensis]TQF15752.1 hypothetical protein FJV41_11785 [Myxococcus llanfairpwllgwyngyllgogerychwyrndrobwllllantysiliogogogochensis]